MIEARTIACRYQKESAGLKYPSHLPQGLLRGMEVRYQANSHDKVEGTFRKREAVRISKDGKDGGTQPSTSRMLPCRLQHVFDGVHSHDKITALSQCHCAHSGPASNFENSLPGRHCQLIDPSQNNRQALPKDRALDADFLVNLSPLSHMRLEVRVDEFLLLRLGRKISPHPWQATD